MLLSSPRVFLQQLLHLMILRRHGEYQTNSIEHPELYHNLFEVQTQSPSQSFFMTFLEILTTMQLNMEDTDFCTVESANILAMASLRSSLRYRSRVTVILAMAISFFCSRQFLALLKDRVAATDVITPRKCQAMVIAVINGCRHAADLFTRAFNPNRLQGSQVAKHRRPKTKTRCLWRAALRKVINLNLVARRSRRRQFCKVGRSLGCFRGKNFWQLVKLGTSPLSSHLRCPRRHQVPGQGDAYTETGPGARAMLNMLEQLPRQFCLNVNGQACADVFNKWLHKWWKVWRKLCQADLRNWPAKFHLDIKHFYTLDAVAFQFVLCEGSKVFNFVSHHGCIYARGYWRSFPSCAQLPDVNIPEEQVLDEIRQSMF